MATTPADDGTDAISEEDDRIYRTCLAAGPLSLSELAERVGLTSCTVERRVTGLRRLGLLGQDGGEINALPPRAPLRDLADDLESAAIDARRRASRWATLWQQHRERAPYLEVLDTHAEAAAADDGLLQSAHHQVRSLQVGPIRSTKRPGPPRIPEGFFAATARGVRFQVVYGVGILQDPEGLAAVRASIDTGEEARVFPDVPLNVAIADDRLAMITFAGTVEDPRNAALVHPSGMLDALISLFESYWRLGVPLTAETDADPTAGRGPDADTHQLLAYLSAGLTDQSIARELGVSERTVGRRIARLQELLGAQSRFQLGSQATRRGWI